MSETTYRFTPLLQSDSFRVLHLLPDKASADVRCRLITTRLSEKPRYRALSYVWGSRVPAAKVLCDGETIIITKNCELALVKLRKADEEVELWIDSICINQDDLEERGHQVKNMGKIYRQAASVLISLGPAGKNDTSEMKRLVSIFSNVLLKPLSDGMSLRDALNQPVPQDFDAQFSSKDLEVWKRTMSLPYWTRTWVMQEVGLAAEATLMYGDDKIHWKDLMRAFIWLSDSRHSLLFPSGRAIRSSWAGYDRHNRRQFSLRADALTSDITFLDCLDNARRERDATDPRDLVYAFLEHPDIHRFDPNYLLDVGTVYYNFAVSCLQEHNNLNALSYATRSAEFEPMENLPSWCPQWNDKGPYPYPFAGLNRSKDYNTAGSMPLEFKIEGPCLRVSGVHIGTVSFVTAPISAQHIIEPNKVSPTGSNSLVEAFQASQSEDYHCGEQYSNLIASFAWAITAGKGLLEVKDLQKAVRGPEPNAESVSEWYLDIEAGGHLAALNRCFFILPDGYMGLGPPGMKVGDICSVVFGSTWAYILRNNSNGTHQLVGECYIEGVVDGRVITMLERGELQSIPIVLV